VTLAVVFKGTEGIALAADSRVTLSMRHPNGQETYSYFDNATKMLSVQGQPYVGIVTSGAGTIGTTAPRTAHGFMPEFEEELGQKHSGRASVEEVARELGRFYRDQWSQAGMPVGQPGTVQMQFLIAGFDERDAYGRVFKVTVPDAPDPVEQAAGTFGLTIDGQAELVGRLLSGFDPAAIGAIQRHLALDAGKADDLRQKLMSEFGLQIPFQALPLQDCVDLAAFLVGMTSAVQRWTTGLRGVGGAIDVATITRAEGFAAIKQKKIEVRE
jgi:hypothetical protein